MSAYRFLPGLIIVQVATAGMVIAAGIAPEHANWLLVAVASAVITLLVGFWFASIAEHAKKDMLAEAREKFARERERLVVAAEAEKRTIVENSHRQIVQETNRAHAKANFKLGAAVVGMMGIAGVLLYVELFTLALVTLTTVGGALAGYVARVRQETLALRREKAEKALLSSVYTVERVESEQPLTRTALTRDSKRTRTVSQPGAMGRGAPNP